MTSKTKSNMKNKKAKRWQVVYKTEDGRTELYTVDKPIQEDQFGNADEGQNIVGFTTYCHNREGIRRFRYDRLVTVVS
jgi:hypothetical protein